MPTLSEEKRHIVRDSIGNYYSIIKTVGDFYLAQERESGKYVILNKNYEAKSIFMFSDYKLINELNENKNSFKIFEIVAILKHKMSRIGIIYSLFNYKGDAIYNCNEIFATDSHYFIVKNNGKYGLIDEYCKEIIPCMYGTKEAIPRELFTEIIEIMN